MLAISMVFATTGYVKADTRAHVEYEYSTPLNPESPIVQADLIIDRFQDGGGTSFWLRVRQTVTRAGAGADEATIDEVVSIRDFPVAEYRKIIGHLRKVQNWTTDVSGVEFCDSRYRTISLNRKTLNVGDLCLPDGGYNPQPDPNYDPQYDPEHDPQYDPMLDPAYVPVADSAYADDLKSVIAEVRPTTVEPRMRAAIRAIDRLVEQTISYPDATYQRTRVDRGTIDN